MLQDLTKKGHDDRYFTTKKDFGFHPDEGRGTPQQLWKGVAEGQYSTGKKQRASGGSSGVAERDPGNGYLHWGEMKIPETNGEVKGERKRNSVV